MHDVGHDGHDAGHDVHDAGHDGHDGGPGDVHGELEEEVEVQDCKVEDILVVVQLVLAVAAVVAAVAAGKAGGWQPWPSSTQRPPVLTG